MTLELVLLISFVGLTVVSSFGGDTGLTAQFADSGPILAARMERRMATARCFQLAQGGEGTPCETTTLFEGPSSRR